MFIIVFVRNLSRTIFLSLSAVACLAGCSGSLELSIPETSGSTHEYVIVVHGDGGYLLHDEAGNAIHADEKILDQILEVTASLNDAEVFIFHQKKRKRRFLFFTEKGGVFYHYKNGSALTTQRYERHPERGGLFDERALYQSRTLDGDSMNTRAQRESFFLYFGHQIPETPVQGYHASFPSAEFSISDLKEGISLWRADSGGSEVVFEGIVLSTCNNGSPFIVDALSPYTSYVMASPTNLHLSHFPVDYLREINRGSLNTDPGELLESWVDYAYEALTGRVQTVVSIALYDTRKTARYLSEIMPRYVSHMEEMITAPGGNEDLVVEERADCAHVDEFVRGAREDMSQGVYVLYRPPQFGREKNQENHSGWNCLLPPD